MGAAVRGWGGRSVCKSNWTCPSAPLPQLSVSELGSLIGNVQLVWSSVSGTNTQHRAVHTVTSQLLHRLYLRHNNTSSVTNLVTTFSEELMKASSRYCMLACYLDARNCCAVDALGILLKNVVLWDISLFNHWPGKSKRKLKKLWVCCGFMFVELHNLAPKN